MARKRARKRTAVLISGRGSNMRALIKAAADPGYPAEIALVIANRPDAGGLDYARSAGVATLAIDHTRFASREAFDAEVDGRLRDHAVELVACAGFMRVLTAGFIAAWERGIINIHPSLLPLYKGLNTHQRALADGVRVHGCTVHFVAAEIDAGPIIAQAAVPVLSGDTAEMLAARVLQAEHRLYPMALALVAGGQARREAGKAVVAAPGDPAAQLFSPNAG